MNKVIFAAGLFGSVLSGCFDQNSDSNSTDSSSLYPDYARVTELGGSTSTNNARSSAFSEKAPNLSISERRIFASGNVEFEQSWTFVGNSVESIDGLGPIFNMRSCQGCHINDGRGHAPSAVQPGQQLDHADSLLVRLFRTPTDEERVRIDSAQQANANDPVYGGQIQDRAITNGSPQVAAEANIAIEYETIPVTFTSDNFTVELRKPIFSLMQLQYGPLGDTTYLSPRIANPMIGLGLLENIAADDIVGFADENDLDGNAISGRANYVLDEATQQIVLGRFGWKAGQPSLHQQNSAAFLGDMGLTTPLFQTQNCPELEDADSNACLLQPTGVNREGGDLGEVQVSQLEDVLFYTQHLAVPERRNVEASEVLAGAKLFNDVGCVDCHRPSYTTQINAALPALSEQKIYPFTDMLLHDMGPALADTTPNGEPAPEGIPVEFKATSHEWRTPPLWGIGLSQTVSAEATFLHDGRARSLLEAVLWHGGEAEHVKQKVLTFTADERAQLIAFLNSL